MKYKVWSIDDRFKIFEKDARIIEAKSVKEAYTRFLNEEWPKLKDRSKMDAMICVENEEGCVKIAYLTIS